MEACRYNVVDQGGGGGGGGGGEGLMLAESSKGRHNQRYIIVQGIFAVTIHTSAEGPL